jgi:hypothetical protein
MGMKSLLGSLVRFGVRCVDKSPRLRRFLDHELCAARDWRELDHLYTVCRRRLDAHPEWRFGPRRTGDIAAFVLDELGRWGTLQGKVYCDVGCGTLNPYGTAAFVYLNGADATWSLDVSAVTDHRRAAEALFDLLVDCAVRPDFWHRSDLPRDEYLRRWHRFDLAKLRDGDLEGGIAGLPFRHVVGDIRNGLVPDGSVHLLSSEAVVEHLDDLPRAAARLYALMAPGGVAAHNVDVRDHRIYSTPRRYTPWSFMEEEDDAPLKNWKCNGLRCGEVIACFEGAGFKVHALHRIRETPPPGLRDRLRGRYAALSDEELETVGFTCVMTRSRA